MAVTNTGIVERTITGVNESDLFLDSEATSVLTNTGIVERSLTGVNESIAFRQDVRTNLLPYSQDFSNVAWAKTRCTIDGGGHISPSGASDAFKMTATDNDARLQDLNRPVGVIYTQSVYVKSATGNDVSGQIDFTGTFIQTFTANNEWQRVETTSNTTRAGVFRVRITNSGDELLVWGAQLEEAAHATSYIPTNGTPVTIDSNSTSVVNNTGIVERPITGSNESELWLKDGLNILDTGVLASSGGGSFTITDSGLKALSDGSSSFTLRPRILWNSLTIGNEYRIVGTPTINSGSTNYSLYNGASYEKNQVAVEAFDITFTCNGVNVFFTNDGTQAFDIDWDLKLYDNSQVTSVINNTGIVERPIIGINESTPMFLNYSDSKVINLANHKPLFEEFTNPLVGYSLRSLSSDTVSVVRIRRDSDDAEQDFTAEEITNGTLLSFTGNNNGLVSVWYDQSGNSNDMTEATLSNQPTLVSNGVVNLENGKPCIVFDGNLIGTNITNEEGAESLFIVASEWSEGSPVALLKSATADKILLFQGAGDYRARYNGTNPTILMESDLMHNAYSIINSPSSFSFYKNSELIGEDTSATANFISTSNKRLNLGSRYEGNNVASVKIQEVIYYDSDLTSENSLLISNQDNHYGLNLFETKSLLLPDASGGDVGQGFTITGLYVDERETDSSPVDNFVIYCSNHGQNIQLPAGNGLPNKASIVKLLVDINGLSLSKPTIIEELKVYQDVNFGEGKSIQGICVNNENNIVFLSPTDSKAYVYTKGGVFVNSYLISGDTPNGLAFDSNNNYYLVYTNTGSLRRFDSNFSLVDTFTIAANGDQVFYNNKTNRLYLSVDPSRYKIYDSSFVEQHNSVNIDGVLSIEGISTSGKYMFVANDGYYHETNNINSIVMTRFKS